MEPILRVRSFLCFPADVVVATRAIPHSAHFVVERCQCYFDAEHYRTLCALIGPSALIVAVKLCYRGGKARFALQRTIGPFFGEGAGSCFCAIHGGHGRTVLHTFRSVCNAVVARAALRTACQAIACEAILALACASVRSIPPRQPVFAIAILLVCDCPLPSTS